MGRKDPATGHNNQSQYGLLHHLTPKYDVPISVVKHKRKAADPDRIGCLLDLTIRTSIAGALHNNLGN